MKSMKTRNKQSGFLAVGVGLLLTAVFGVTAATVSKYENDEQIGVQPIAQVPDQTKEDSGS